ncbi:CTR1-like protein [Mya arenaria]|uniref:CTR1-like protein n=1 Tax=Mya arenaria TaxID=6604 RepID=A0ABY7FC35_MYAAR|nr:dual specificity protein kinase splB-like [Mya arenaria]XP_052766351.1 dual specificity protein kinase splB-like [Mya arenaria]WAR19713.1 CTR1-like protein [Mya arenaria]
MPRSYVNNASNRSLGRVGMPVGSMVVSRSGGGGSATGGHGSYASPKTYVDNPLNRSLGRVGKEHGTAVVSKAEKSGPGPATFSRETPSTPDVYKDNALNQKLGRVGLPKGSMPVSIEDPGSTKVYVDNYMNRKLGRVGKIIGTAVHHKQTGEVKTEVYVNSPDNRHRDRVGKPRGSRPPPKKSNKTKGTQKMIKKLDDGDELEDFEDYRDINDDFYPDITEHDYREHLENAIYHLNRHREELDWNKTHGSKPKTMASLLTNFQGSIPFSELSLNPERKIGEGGFGEVFLSEWNGSAVAVKKLKDTKFSKRLEDGFKREILTFSALEHPNIVKFLGACVERPNVCIVMEYMQMSLYDALHIKPDITFSETECLDVITDVCKGMKYLHGENIAHCDLKTLNVLINYSKGETCIAKITDFGLSLVKNSTQTTSTKVDEFVSGLGTPRYSAPEILRGEILKASDMMKADIWSLGLIIYETIFEEEPFVNLSFIQLKVQVGEKHLIPDMDDDVIINPDVKEALLQTWKSEPGDRIEIGKLTEVVESAQYVFVQ